MGFSTLFIAVSNLTQNMQRKRICKKKKCKSAFISKNRDFSNQSLCCIKTQVKTTKIKKRRK